MISFQTFDQWFVLTGYLSAIFFLIIAPFAKKSEWFFSQIEWWVKIIIPLIILLAIVIPFLVIIPNEETNLFQNKVLGYSGKFIHIEVFTLFYFTLVNYDKLGRSLKYFWIFVVFMTLYSALDLMIIEVLLAAPYKFWESIFPYLQQIGIKNTNFTDPINYLIKFIFLSLFFRDLFQDPLKKRFFQYLMHALVVFELVQVFVFKSYQGYDSLSSTVKNVFILGSTGLFMYKLYRADSHGITLYKNPYFWLTLGLMLPALAEIFLEFIFTKLYQTDLLSFYKLYLVRNASQIVGFTLLIVGVWQAKYLRFLPKEY